MTAGVRETRAVGDKPNPLCPHPNTPPSDTLLTPSASDQRQQVKVNYQQRHTLPATAPMAL